MKKTIKIDEKRLKQVIERMSKQKKDILETKPNSNISIRDLKKRMNEELMRNPQAQLQPQAQAYDTTERYLTDNELDAEMDKFRDVFTDYNVAMEFEKFIILDNAIIWGGTIDQKIDWVYKVTPDDATSGVELNFAPDFNPDEEDNKKIVSLIENYYNQFYAYWSKNELELDNGINQG